MLHSIPYIRLLRYISVAVLIGCFGSTVRVVIGGAAATFLSTGENVENMIDTYIHDYDIMVFAKSYCPHCKTSKSIIELLQQETTGEHYIWSEKFLYLDEMENPNDATMIQNALLEKTGQRTVPNIFINGKHIGGNSDLVTLYQSGDLLHTIQEIAISRGAKTEL